MNEHIDLEKCTTAVCEIARRAGAYIREERQKFSLESVERKALTISRSEPLSTYDT